MKAAGQAEAHRSSASGRAHPTRNAGYALLFLAPWILTFLVFWLYPLVFSFLLSFCDYDVFHAGAFRWTGFDNFSRLLADARFRQAFGNTLFFVLGTTPVTTVLALALALLIERVRVLQGLFRSAFFLPSIISMVVIATIFKSFYAPDGLLNAICSVIGLSRHAWLIEPVWALPVIMAMDIWSSVGYYMVLFLAALKSVPPQLYEAAEVDGAGEWAQFRHITLPQIRGMALFIIVINTIRSWQVFPEIFTLTRGGPLGTTDTLVHRVYEAAFRYHEMGYASAMAWVLFAVIMALSLLQMRILQEKSR
ncbi:MAG TPA: sugar ABC transporter permease [Candidatus Ozemobacteraceae bacterium]